MYGDAAYAETAYGEGTGLVAPIIPEVGVETRQLIYAIELELISVGITAAEPEPAAFALVASFDAIGQAQRTVSASFDAIGESAVIPGADIFWLAPAPAGSDSNSGTEASPWLTLSKANSMVGPGDTVILKAGTYQQANITLSASGSSGNPILWQSQVRHSAIVQPTSGQSSTDGITVTGDYIHLDGLQIDGTPRTALLSGVALQGSHLEARNCWVHHVRALGAVAGGQGIVTSAWPTTYTNTDVRVYNCRVNDVADPAVMDNTMRGIYLTNSDAQAFNNLVYRVPGTGIFTYHQATTAHVHNNTVFACLVAGIAMGHDTPGSLSNSKVSNNIVIGCPTGIRSTGTQGTGNEARNNTAWNCGTPFSIAVSWTQTGGGTTDPGLVNYQADGSGDYTPTRAGTAADSGISTWAPTTDYAGTTRPKGAGVDRGAFEALPSVAATFDAVGAVSGMIDFGVGNTTRYYSIPNTAALNLGAGAWAWGMKIRADTNAGTDYNYVLSFSALGATPQVNLALAEASVADGASFANRWHFRTTDNAGVDGTLHSSTTATGGDGIERLVVLQSTGTTLELWICPTGGTATRVVNAAVNLGAITASASWNFGRLVGGTTTSYFEAWAGGLFKANVALSQANIEAIAGTSSPVTVLGGSCIAFWPFGGAHDTVTDVVGGIVATRNGTGW